jgi:hypothetical protein
MTATLFAFSSNFGKVNHRSVSQIVRTSRIAWSGFVSSRKMPSKRVAGPFAGAVRGRWPEDTAATQTRINASFLMKVPASPQGYELCPCI